ncbi:MAG: hypothetical protein ACI4AA_00500 [Lachnospiraceae bacterium]
MKILNSRKNRLLLPFAALLFYIAHAFLLRNQVNNIFSQDIVWGKTQYAAVALSMVFGYGVYLCIFSALYFLCTGNRTFLRLLKEFMIYFIPMFLLLLCTWPGIFKGDEFYVLQAVRKLTFSPAQTGITSLFYIACLRFFPSMASISFFQVVIICCIYAYIFYQLKIIYPGKNLILCRIVCFLLPVLDGNLFTLRATLAGWIFLLVMCMCLFAWKKQALSTKQLLVISLLCGLIIAWRSEYIYLLLFIPLAAKLVYKKNRKQVFLCFLVILISFQGFNIPNKIALNGSNKYPISLVINPLGNIFAQDEIRGETAYDDIMTINELIDVQALRLHPSVRNISQYWNIPDVLPEDQLHEFMAASMRLILNNFDHFLYYRWLTFAHTNGMFANEINHPTAPTSETIYTLTYYGEDYKNSYYFMQPVFGEKVRNAVIDFLSCRNYTENDVRTNILYPVFYNCLPTILIALICMIICLCKKKFVPAGILFLTGAQIVLIFLTAPAMFFMYYFCFYLTGYFCSALAVLELRSTPVSPL